MININDSAKERTFDAIVIGSGISGGWAAKELTEKGLKTLVLERGRNVQHLKDYPTTNMMPWEFPHRGQVPLDIAEANPVVSRCYAYREDAMHFFVKDQEHPYVQDKPFDWIRGYQVGGKSLLWARQTQRWSDFDFEGPARDGFAVDWPIRYKDLAPWYSHVEKFAGISGDRDGLPQLPDGEFLPAVGLNDVEKYFRDVVAKSYKDRHVIYGRCAHLTEPQQIHLDQGRVQCQNRTLCQRGCPFGGYFSSNASTLPWAAKTGNLTLQPDSVVQEILYDDKKQKATGVRVIDAHTKAVTDYFAKVIFVNAGALNTNLLLLNSVSGRFPNGLGNDSGTLGKYVAFHNYRARISALCHDFKQVNDEGRRPTSAYLPRFRNLYKQETDFLRGYAAGFFAGRGNHHDTSGFGRGLKEQLAAKTLGPWYVGSHMMGETIPKASNTVSLDPSKKDEWGMPLLHINIAYDDNDEKMVKDFQEQFTEMYTKAGFTDIRVEDSKQAPGLDIHEMGGARMGHDPETSVLNKWNQVHACTNVFVTDGACMTSTSTQNPSLTYMALSARAVDHAVTQLKKGEI
ncbi:GMC oxidoreductase [Chitinophaga japonensis]|uniref:Choline dehydrogenase-like flavoprotein n=1 Tax=Chitinophaga japonensis TaxID=104662 RepID=A0A562T5H8_CHIJA|nr:GMC family oxidoreductase [Chitinophaga japonensis]TWI88797.1 choline dehydrogenase-like flavoprotein [Chitinophaga japonensis]